MKKIIITMLAMLFATSSYAIEKPQFSAGLSLAAGAFKAEDASEKFTWSSPKSKNVDYKVEHPVFFEDINGLPQISYIDQFPEPKNMKQGQFLQKLSDALEGSKNKVITKLPIGSAIIANNYFWLHGRKPFKVNKNLSRELLRIRGSFFH